VREARLSGSLNHPNVVTVHDFFEDGPTPYIAMEYVERASLRPFVADLSVAETAGVIEVCSLGSRTRTHAGSCIGTSSGSAAEAFVATEVQIARRTLVLAGPDDLRVLIEAKRLLQFLDPLREDD
jgi:hypothetical protein